MWSLPPAPPPSSPTLPECGLGGRGGQPEAVDQAGAAQCQCQQQPVTIGPAGVAARVAEGCEECVATRPALPPPNLVHRPGADGGRRRQLERQQGSQKCPHRRRHVALHRRAQAHPAGAQQIPGGAIGAPHVQSAGYLLAQPQHVPPQRSLRRRGRLGGKLQFTGRHLRAELIGRAGRSTL
eukprot:scaffold9265_cov101-Isochrysis_galbana.AAC.2